MYKKNTPNLILRIALAVPLRRQFDYLPPENVDLELLIPGIRVLVPFQSRSLVGILLEVVETSSVPLSKLKAAHELIDTQPLLTEEIHRLCIWAADYYHYALGEVLFSALPSALRKAKPAVVKAKKEVKKAVIEAHIPELNAAQHLAVESIINAKNTFKVFLLDGVTGSGKTEVYLRAIQAVLNEDKQILLLVPEISLTPQTIQRFSERFREKIVALHSNLSEQQRLRGWLEAKSAEAKIVIGTRSAAFTPFANLGLIIVDEEHDTSFKQQDRFRYHARDLVIMRAHFQGIPIVLGSATPSLESLQNVKRQRYTSLSLPHRAGGAFLPQFQMIDLRQSAVEEGLSTTLIKMMREHLDQGNQVMLFLNRRGFAPVLYCTQCAWIAVCKRCDARMVYHRTIKRLQCHHCDTRTPIPTRCTQCNAESLHPVGVGTQRLEEALSVHFPHIPVIRVDRDNTRRKDDMEKLLQQIHTGQKSILLGTQMLAKGHHFPDVTLVGIIDADSGLFSADFRAAEQMGQLLLQVAGRAGRANKPGTVAIQTKHPEHTLLQTLIHKGYPVFAEMLLSERELAVLPPFSYVAVFRAESYLEQNAIHFLSSIKNMLPQAEELLTILGPVPALLSKRKGLHCQHLLIKTQQRGALQNLLKNILQKLEGLNKQPSVKWILDVDPVEV